MNSEEQENQQHRLNQPSSSSVATGKPVAAQPATSWLPLSTTSPLAYPLSSHAPLPSEPQQSQSQSQFLAPSQSQLAPSQLRSQSGDPATIQTFIWATTVNVESAQRAFHDFLMNFTPRHRLTYENTLNEEADGSDDVDTPYYPRVLQQRLMDEQWLLNLDCRNLLAYDTDESRRLYSQLIRYPTEMLLHVLDVTVHRLFMELYGEQWLQQLQQSQQQVDPDQILFKVRPFNLESSINLRDLNPEDIDKLVSVKGFVVRVSDLLPELKVAAFQCAVCDYMVEVQVMDGKVNEPSKCPNCMSAAQLQLVHGRCLFYNKQIIRIQETPDAVPDGQTPHTVSLVVYDELLDVCKPGDRIEATGIYKAMPIRVHPRMRVTRSLFKTYVDVLHVSSTERMRVGGQVVGGLDRGEEGQVEQQLTDSIQLNPHLERQIQQLSEQPDVYERLSRSLAPNIFENEDTKKAVLLQLFGGSGKTFRKSEATRYRGNIHVLLVGDPATSKSQILQYVHRIAPRGIYTSGKGSSAVGLTAYVTRDPETRQLVLESGALVLSDGGICCIDEFDKMSDHTRSVLHEVMEQQTVSVAKAGIIATLNARTSILAAANPIHSKWNPKLPVVQNVNLPPTLLSRFDLICIMLDQPDEARDTRLAKHLMTLYLSDEDAQSRRDPLLVDVETFAAYVSYAREHVHPRISDDCMDFMAEQYVQFRQKGTSANMIAATTRQLEAIIRLSEAHAKMRLSQMVERSDVEEAVRLIYTLMKMAALDPTTGLFDMDLLTTGTSARQRSFLQGLKRDLRELLLTHLNRRSGGGSGGEGVLKSDVLAALRQSRGGNSGSGNSGNLLTEAEFETLLGEVCEETPQFLLRQNMILFERAR